MTEAPRSSRGLAMFYNKEKQKRPSNTDLMQEWALALVGPILISTSTNRSYEPKQARNVCQ